MVTYLARILYLVLAGRLLWRAEAKVAQRRPGEAHAEELVDADAGRAGALVRGVVEVNERRSGGGVCYGEGGGNLQSADDACKLGEEHRNMRV